MNKSIRFLVAAGLIGGGCWVTYAWGQQSTQPIGPADPSVQDPARFKAPVAPVWALPTDPISAAVPVPPPAMHFEPPIGRLNGGGGGFGGSGFGGGGFGGGGFGGGGFGGGGFGGGGFGGGGFGGGMRREEIQAFQAAVEKLRSAKEGTEKEAAKKELLQRLEQSFKRDLEHREQEVAEIESRVKKLREQIERRKKAKDEIVGLRLKTIVNESEGLGFSGDFVPTVKHDAMGPALRPDPPSSGLRYGPDTGPVPDDGR